MAAIPFVKDLDFTYGAPDRVLPGVRRVIANNPGPFTYTGSGTYLIGDADIAVIDPGPDNDDHLAALMATVGDGRVSHILITHTHSDHCGGARQFADMTGAPIYGFGPHPARKNKSDDPALDEGADFGFTPDEFIEDGDVVSGSDWRLEALHTPGHLSNHLCFALPDRHALFTGDHMMGWSTTVIAPPDGDMGDYFDSLDKLINRDDEIYFPTHGAPIPKPQRFVRAVKTHRLMRDAQIIEQIKKKRQTIREIVPVLYADIDERLHKAAALNILAHLIRLVRIGTLACDGEPAVDTVYRLA